MIAEYLDEPNAEPLATDADSYANFKVGELVYLTKPYLGFEPGDVFQVIAIIPCTGGSVLRHNARVVCYGQPAVDAFFHRTMPAEYLRWTPKPGEQFSVDRNQGDRPARCLDRIGRQALCDYEMPAGRVFLFIRESGRDRPVSVKALPKKWTGLNLT